MSPSRSFLSFVTALLAPPSLVLIVACTSSGDQPSTDDDACSVLSACCGTLTGAQAQTCLSTVKGIEDDGELSQCASTFTSYQSQGLCGGDAGSGADAASSPDGSGGRVCQVTATCTNGASIETCTATLDGGCVAAVVITNGPAFGCDACGDCTTAATDANNYCQQYLTPDAAAD